MRSQGLTQLFFESAEPSFELPTGVTALGNEFKFEIIVRTTTGNNTALENCFIVQ